MTHGQSSREHNASLPVPFAMADAPRSQQALSNPLIQLSRVVITFVGVVATDVSSSIAQQIVPLLLGEAIGHIHLGWNNVQLCAHPVEDEVTARQSVPSYSAGNA